VQADVDPGQDPLLPFFQIGTKEGERLGLIFSLL
jgi:hypothetical protein